MGEKEAIYLILLSVTFINLKIWHLYNPTIKKLDFALVFPLQGRCPDPWPIFTAHFSMQKCPPKISAEIKIFKDTHPIGCKTGNQTLHGLFPTFQKFYVCFFSCAYNVGAKSTFFTDPSKITWDQDRFYCGCNFKPRHSSQGHILKNFFPTFEPVSQHPTTQMKHWGGRKKTPPPI